MNEQPSLGRPRFDDSEREKELKEGILKIAELQGNLPPPPQEEDEEMEDNEEEGIELVTQKSGLKVPSTSNLDLRLSTGSKRKKNSARNTNNNDGDGGKGVGKSKSKAGGNKKQPGNKTNNSGKVRKSRESKSKRKSGRKEFKREVTPAGDKKGRNKKSSGISGKAYSVA